MSGGIYFLLIGLNYVAQGQVSYAGVVRLQQPVDGVCLQGTLPVFRFSHRH